MKEKDDEDKQIYDVYFLILVSTFVKLEIVVGSWNIIMLIKANASALMPWSHVKIVEYLQILQH
jgi:hypothetical protein